jgi:hypothetical protein
MQQREKDGFAEIFRRCHRKILNELPIWMSIFNSKSMWRSQKELGFSGGKFSTWFQIIFAAAMILSLWAFLTRNPMKELLPLWGNRGEVKSALLYLVLCVGLSAWAALTNRMIYCVLAVCGAFLATAGPAAILWSLLTTASAVAVGYQLVGPIATRRLATSDVARFALAFWVGKSLYLLILSVLSFFPVNTRFSHGCVIVALLFFSPRGVHEVLRVTRLFIKDERIHSSRINVWSITSFFFLLSALLLILSVVHPGFDGDAATMHMRVGREMLSKGLWAYDVTDYGFAVMPLAPQLNFSAMFLVGGLKRLRWN